MASIDSRIARTISGNPITAEARAAPVQRNANTMPNQSSSTASDRTVPAEQHQQRKADHDRRQHERQMHDRIDQRLSGKREARQAIGHEDRQRQAADDADQRHAQAERQDSNLVRTEPVHRLLRQSEAVFLPDARAAGERR